MLATLVLTAALAGAPTVIVTTSMLEAAVAEVAPPPAVRVVALLPPAACPGHFDLPAGTLAVLHDADLVLRHTFEAALDARLRAAGGEPVAVPEAGALTLPGNYAELVDAVRAALAERFPARAHTFATNAAAARTRIIAIDRALRERARPMAGTQVVASAMQAELCRHLGLDVIATFPRGEDATPRTLERLLALRPAFVVANLQEGTSAAEGLASRLGTPIAVVSNFPDAAGYGSGWHGLAEANLARLLEAWRISSSR